MTRDLEWLRETLSGVDRVFWDGQLEALGVSISWARFRPVKNTIRLGCCRPATKRIRHPRLEMHMVLAEPWVPIFVVSQLVYHETVHALQIPPLTRISAGLKHDAAFRELELRHPYTVRTEHWVEENIVKLLAARPQRGSV